jgi:GxxExxY protein
VIEPAAEDDAIARAVVDAAITVHRALGPGLLESVYEQCLAHELEQRGLRLPRQVAVPVVYRGIRIETGFRLDLLVADTVIVEVKAVETLLPVHTSQILNYLKLCDRPLGLLINFNVPMLKQGLRRFVRT